MIDIIDGNAALIHFFPLPAHLYSKNIACIVAVAHAEERGPNLTGLINALYSKGYTDLEHLFNSTWKKLYQVPRLGQQRLVLLLSLLERISADPKTIETYTAVPHVTIHSKKEMKELTLKRIIKKYNETSVEVLTEDTEKEARLKKIKDRLREMGMIV
ncbi:hypothetical protein NSQ91_20125 [Paenibacillus sp. FSL R7-0048]|jgi:hypothetical protein|uniref:hypothetical protein n=1 Tax=Paenibacillus TaxID=44249 RepID=UPI00096CD362|nr:hypothetical protein [Paenibacillus odorifer]OMD70258.1 hypothetical protein BSK48_15185 [Paenibacillus odorifer]OMD77536.1 hypothetical protein BSK50_12395 [Paenibacillus odorifer]OME03667.1 hypothetical protein BSK54_06085 [Paenibacillus odorifer]